MDPPLFPPQGCNLSRGSRGFTEAIVTWIAPTPDTDPALSQSFLGRERDPEAEVVGGIVVGDRVSGAPIAEAAPCKERIRWRAPRFA
jgi:hypothetical protein